MFLHRDMLNSYCPMAPDTSMSKKQLLFPPGSLLQTIEDLDDPGVSQESAHRLASPRVVWADYELLQHDFPRLRNRSLLAARPELRKLRGKRRQSALRGIVDGWVLRHGAVISCSQAAQEVVNSRIEISAEAVEVFRPPRYGRSLVVPVSNDEGSAHPGLLDLKGVGTAPDVVPADHIHGNGLMSLREALTDLMMQKAMESLFRHAQSDYWCVPIYAVLDPGFDVFSKVFPAGPAAIQVRRAHRRPRGGAELPFHGSDEQFVKFELEMLLRQYGITSANRSTEISFALQGDQLETSYGGHPVGDYWQDQEKYREFLDAIGVDEPARFEGINIQLTREVVRNPSSAQLVDFGHYQVRESFELPVVSLVRNRVLRWGGCIAPGSPHFVQPRSNLRLPVEQWRGRRCQANFSRLATRFRAGDLDREALEAQLGALLTTATSRWEVSVAETGGGTVRDP